MNLEVVRARAVQGAEGAATRIAPFAESASGQLESVIAMTEALLALSRRARAPVSVVRTVRALGALLAPAATVAGGQLTMHLPGDGSGVTAAGGDVVRALLAAALLSATGRATHATLTVAGDDALDLTLSCDDGIAPTLDPRIAAAAAQAGIRIGGDGNALTLSFPPPREEPTRETA